MKEDEILEQLSIRPDSRGDQSKGIYNSKSADVHANNGLRGKLTEDQLEERAILHAKRQVTGNPSVAAIIKHWGNQGVEMSSSSEYEWANNNQDRIDQAISMLEQAGDMPIVAVPDSTITNQLAKGARSIIDTMRANKRASEKVLAQVEDMTDIWKMINAKDKEAYFTSEDDRRTEFDKRIDTIVKIRDSHVSALKELSKSSSDHGKTLVEIMKTVSEINKGGQGFDKMLEKKVNDTIKEKGIMLQKKKELEDEDPLAPVTDDERT